MVDQKRKTETIQLPNGQEVKVKRLSEKDVAKRLTEFEEKYGMTSEDFVGKWNRGELDCAEMDYFRWAGYCLFAYKQGHSELQLEG